MFSFLYSKSSHKLFCIFIRHYLVCVLSRFPCGDCRGQYPIHRHTHLRIDTHTHSMNTHKSFLLCFFLVICGQPLGVCACAACLHLHACLRSIRWGWSYMRWPIFSTLTRRERESEMERVGHMRLDRLLTQFHSEERELKEKQQERDSVSVLRSEEISILFYKFTACWESSFIDFW